MRTILFHSDDAGAHPDGGAAPEAAVSTMPELVAAVRGMGENRSKGPGAAY
ncbi:hypothetical protein [Nonomuraea gerenzanensis]|nr:hypothetical protein [Nonomuraea gerenzanensis]UBU17542.1 hypothetical protein LCN96_21695 [Nonomuraea gerenzanensis]